MGVYTNLIFEVLGGEEWVEEGRGEKKSKRFKLKFGCELSEVDSAPRNFAPVLAFCFHLPTIYSASPSTEPCRIQVLGSTVFVVVLRI